MFDQLERETNICYHSRGMLRELCSRYVCLLLSTKHMKLSCCQRALLNQMNNLLLYNIFLPHSYEHHKVEMFLSACVYIHYVLYYYSPISVVGVSQIFCLVDVITSMGVISNEKGTVRSILSI